MNFNETRRDVALANESHKKWVKDQYDKLVQPRVFNEGDLVLTYDQKHDKLGKEKIESMWYVPFIMSKVLEKGAYEIVDYDGIYFGKPHNGLYQKKRTMLERSFAFVPCIYAHFLAFSVVFII